MTDDDLMRYEKNYTYRVRWSEEDSAYIATVAEMPLLSWIDDYEIEALRGIHNLVREALGILRQDGAPIPEPIATKRYSGKILVRIPPEAHRQLALEAAEQHVSMNRLASQRLMRA